MGGHERGAHAQLPGLRAARVVAHGPAPRGFLVHGGEATLWTAYVNRGVLPRGADFVRAVKELAERANVDPSPLERSEPRDRKAELLQEVDALCRRELMSERGWRARGYLESRGIPSASIEDSGLGLFPARDHVESTLTRAGYGESEIAASGVLADSRWPGRLVGAWRDERGQPRTAWARALAENTDARYLYLRGSRRGSFLPMVSPRCSRGHLRRAATSCSSRVSSTSTSCARTAWSQSPPSEGREHVLSSSRGSPRSASRR